MCTKQNDQSDMFQGTGPLMRVARLKWRKLPVSASRHNSHKWKKNHSLTKFRFRLRSTENTFVLNRTKKSDRCGFLKIVLKDKNHERWRSCWRSEEGHWHVSSGMTISLFFTNAKFFFECNTWKSFREFAKFQSIRALSSQLSWANISSTWGGRLSTVVAFALRSQA